MKPLTNDQKEEIKEVYRWGHFMKSALEYKKDAGSNDLSDEELMLLVEGEYNLDLFSDYQYETRPCETCGSHGSVSVNIGNKTFVLKEW